MSTQPATEFRDLIVWQKAHALVLLVYGVTRKLPKEELFGLVSQMRRAAVSIPANIAEGFKRRGRADKARQMNIAQGSLEELRYYFVLCADLGYLEKDADGGRADEVGRMLTAYIRKLLSPRV
ncbi:MAG: four helix bundle protein [Vicinamibacterales bacterium]